jgi:2-dehydro-3-deoxygluconokinase
LTISVDLNYRSKLWQYGIAPKEVMLPLLSDCDVVMGNMWSVDSLLGIAAPIHDSNGKSIEELIAAAEVNITSLQDLFPKIKHIAYTFRLAENYFGVLHQDKTTTVSNIYKINEVIDKVGSGDYPQMISLIVLQLRLLERCKKKEMLLNKECQTSKIK